MNPVIEAIIEEQIASLRSSESIFVQQRAEALASAQNLSTQEPGALTRVEELQDALDTLQAATAPSDKP